MALKIVGYTVALSLIFCIHFILKKHRELKNSDQFTGSVIGYERHNRSGRRGSTYALKIEYKNTNSISQVFIAAGASSPPALPLGAKVRVFQHRDGSNPDVLIFQSVYLGLWIWFCIGVCVLGCLCAPYLLNVIYGK